MRPNWAYFETVAGQDDVANGPNTRICPNCRRTVNSTDTGWPNTCRYCGSDISHTPVGPAHIIYDGGPGDTVNQGNPDGTIVFKWDNTTPYSSNEIVYSGDPSVTVQLNVVNFPSIVTDPTFQGTIVARGPVVITAPSSSWIINTGQTLNVVSGLDISNNSSDFAFWSQTESNIHLWAAHDINLNNLKISLASGNTFYGSFTAGDQINFADNSIWTNTNFKWSRWGLDPVAWAPPFKVLEWKEI